jgi:hypothetical protein
MSINLYKAEGSATIPDFSSSKELNDPANYIPSQVLNRTKNSPIPVSISISSLIFA